MTHNPPYATQIIDAEFEELRGFDSVGGWADDLIDMIIDTGTKTATNAAKKGVSKITDIAPGAVDEVLRSSQFKQVLEAVEARAREAVVVETKRNAINLMLLAVAGGAIGGFVFRGVTGTVAASAIAVFAGYQLMTPPAANKGRV
jgi:hypothetical protein